MKLRDLIREADEPEEYEEEESNIPAVLYHGTSLVSGLSILRSGILKAKQASGIEDAGVSLTTDLNTAKSFACDRDGREIMKFGLKADNKTAKYIKWVTDNYSGSHYEKKGLILQLKSSQLWLEPYSHYGMEEEEWRSYSDITGISNILMAFYASPQEIEEWCVRLPQHAAKFKQLLSSEKFVAI
jgi:hypothetical protein